MLDTKIQSTINYHTNRIVKILKLNSSDKDDVRQELTLTALEAKREYEPKGANLTTFVKACLANKAADLIRQLAESPMTANADSMSEVENVQRDYQRQREPSTNDRPLTISMGPQIEQLIESPVVRDLDLKLDIESLWQTLTPQQQEIVEMLENGYTQDQIAKVIGLTQRGVGFRIQKIRQIFKHLQISTS